MFTFSPTKATQAAAFLLGRANRSMNYMKLIKLLYLAERTALSRFETSITGDSFFSLKYGPVLSETLDLIKSETQDPYWERFIQPRKGRGTTVRRRKDPGVGDLSPAEVGILEETWQQYHQLNEFQLAELTHNICPEWKDPSDGRKRIEPADILRAAGRTEREIQDLKRDRAAYNRVVSFLK